MNAGIVSLDGNIALDANQDINMKGGNLTGDNILLAGNNVNISVTIGLDKNGNQIISDKGSISSKNGIQIDAEKDINLKGAQLTSNGIEIEEEEKEKEEIKETSVPPEKKKKEKLEKNLDYYKELLKKDAKDIIEGDSGSINLNASGNISIGGSTNTIGKAELGFNARGGNLWENRESVVQSGIEAEKKLLADTGKNVNLNGAILGSEKNDGSLKVGGNLNLNDLVTTEKKGGAQLTFSDGFTGDFGVNGTIGGTQDKTVKTKSAIGLNIENISIGGDIGVNGEQSEKTN